MSSGWDDETGEYYASEDCAYCHSRVWENGEGRWYDTVRWHERCLDEAYPMCGECGERECPYVSEDECKQRQHEEYAQKQEGEMWFAWAHGIAAALAETGL